jgi:hypothetical protein
MRKQTNYKLPEELVIALQERAAAERTTATDLVIQALNSFLSNSSEEVSRIAPSISDIGERVEQLKERLDKLEANKHIYFMNNSPLSEANEVHIGIDSDTTFNPSNSQEQFADFIKMIEELVLQNQNLCQRVTTLEDLIQKSNCQL